MKKIVIALMVCVLLIGLLAGAAMASEVTASSGATQYDCDRNGVVNQSDISLISAIMSYNGAIPAGLITTYLHCDVNNDLYVNILDALAVAAHI